MHDVPRESVGEHIGIRYEEIDELDQRLARKSASLTYSNIKVLSRTHSIRL